jgi:hypothetical protein
MTIFVVPPGGGPSRVVKSNGSQLPSLTTFTPLDKDQLQIFSATTFPAPQLQYSIEPLAGRRASRRRLPGRCARLGRSPVAAASIDASGNLAEGAVEFFVSKTQVEGLL